MVSHVSRSISFGFLVFYWEGLSIRQAASPTFCEFVHWVCCWEEARDLEWEIWPTYRLGALNSETVCTQWLVIVASQARFIVSNQVNGLEFPFSDWTKRLPYLDIFRASQIQLAISFTSVTFECFELGQKFEYKTHVYHSSVVLGSVPVLAIQAGEAI
jgi:hypothetical protein